MSTHQRGATLIEILVTVVIVSLGLLGVAMLQTSSISDNHDALMYSRARFLAHDITERMLANPLGVRNGGYAHAIGGAVAAGSDCAAATCSTAEMANYDLYQWLEERVKVELPEADAEISSGNWNPTDAGGDLLPISGTVLLRWKGKVGGNCDAAGNEGSDTYKCYSVPVSVP